MPTLDLSKYSNHLSLFDISVQDIEAQLKTYELTFIPVRNRKVEWGMRLPIFLRSFYKYIFNYKKVPSQSTYYTYYLTDNQDWFTENRLSEEEQIGLKARLYRTYPSLVRDLHFAKLLDEKMKNFRTIYNTNLDVKEGIDLLVIYQNNLIAINLYTKTKRAFQGRNVKGNRHLHYENVSYVELPVAFQGSKKIGNFYLYGDREINQLTELLANLTFH